MRKSTMVTIGVFVVLALGTWLFLASPFMGGIGTVRGVSEDFMEDVQFKDFRSSSLYHHKLERDRVDVGKMIERLFMIKPEFLDIIDYRIVKAELSDEGQRARVLVNTTFKRLNMKNKPEEGEIMLYWIRRHPDCPLGSTCPSGECVDEFDKVIQRKDLEESKGIKKSKEEQEKEPPTFACDPNVEPRWFMNLDSTLKEKKYNY